MHELSICHALVQQVTQLAEENGADTVLRIVLRVGPLAGVEPDLLAAAFPIAAAGTLAQDAELVLEDDPLVVRCEKCGVESQVVPNNLLCRVCGDYQTQLISGNQLLLATLEMEGDDDEEDEEEGEDEEGDGDDDGEEEGEWDGRAEDDGPDDPLEPLE